MLGQPISMLIPEVIGFRLTGKLREGVTATDLVLTVTQMLRKKGVVGKFVEFYGPGLDHMTLEDRATIGNMAPEYGATCGFFPIDAETLDYLRTRAARRSASRSSRPMPRRRACGAPPTTPDPVFTDTLELDLDTCSPRSPGRSGRRTASRSTRRQAEFLAAHGHRVPQGATSSASASSVEGSQLRPRPRRRGDRRDHLLHQHLEPDRDDRRGPARPQRRRARASRPSPGSRPRSRRASQVVAEYLAKAGPAGGPRHARLQPRRLRLHDLHRQFRAAAARRSRRRSTTTTSSPPRCSPATAISRAASTRTCAPTISPRRRSSSPMRSPARCRSTSRRSRSATAATASRCSSRTSGRPRRRSRTSSSAPSRSELFRSRYADVFTGDEHWKKIDGRGGLTYDWDVGSTYVQNPPYFEGMTKEPEPVDRHRRRAHPRPLPRLDHHRPHLARRQHPGRPPGRAVPHRAPGRGRRTSTSTARGAATTKS